jgi:hypothetical protein
LFVCLFVLFAQFSLDPKREHLWHTCVSLDFFVASFRLTSVSHLQHRTASGIGEPFAPGVAGALDLNSSTLRTLGLERLNSGPSGASPGARFLEKNFSSTPGFFFSSITFLLFFFGSSAATASAPDT